MKKDSPAQKQGHLPADDCRRRTRYGPIVHELQSDAVAPERSNPLSILLAAEDEELRAQLRKHYSPDIARLQEGRSPETKRRVVRRIIDELERDFHIGPAIANFIRQHGIRATSWMRPNR